MAEKPAKENIGPPPEEQKKNCRKHWSLLRNMGGVKNRRWNPQDRSGLLKVSLKGQDVWNTPCKTKQT